MGFGQNELVAGTITFNSDGGTVVLGEAPGQWWNRMEDAVGLPAGTGAGAQTLAEAAESQKLMKTIFMWATILGIPAALVGGYLWGKRG